MKETFHTFRYNVHLWKMQMRSDSSRLSWAAVYNTSTTILIYFVCLIDDDIIILVNGCLQYVSSVEYEYV